MESIPLLQKIWQGSCASVSIMKNFLPLPAPLPTHSLIWMEHEISPSNNKNAFLNMMDGVLSGKTGFTGNAGYCYVCAMESGGKHLISVVLACGWPGNRTWKWQDTTKLMNYGLSDFEIKTFGDEIPVLAPVPVQTEGVEQKLLFRHCCQKNSCAVREDFFPWIF